MTKNEKAELYRFLTVAQGWAQGFRVETSEPEFADDGIADSRQEVPRSGFATVDDVACAVAHCEGCPLAATRTNAVPGEGPADLRAIEVMAIGEGPGADEDASGRPFVGKAGQLLDRMLASINLSRTENCFIANIVKCRPPQNREPTPEESAACREYLQAQIALVKPKMILALGRTAAQNLLGTSEGINRLRGSFYDYDGIPLLPTYHPSALLRDETLKRPAWEDLKAFRAELDRLKNAQA